MLANVSDGAQFEPISLEPGDIFIKLFETRGGLVYSAASLMKTGKREAKGGTRVHEEEKGKARGRKR